MAMRLSLLAAMMLLMAGCAQDTAQAEIMLMNARRADAAAAIQQKYDQAKADVQATALAEMDLERQRTVSEVERARALGEAQFKLQSDLNRLQTEFTQQMNELDAKHQATLADIQSRIDRARADAARDVLIALAIGLGGALLAVLVGRGIGNGLTAWARNRGESVWPNEAGQYPAIVRSDAVYLPSRMTGAYMVIRRPSFVEKLIVALGHAIAIARGKTPAVVESPWVQMPEPSDAQAQVTARDQATALLTSATRNGVHGAIADRAVTQVLGAVDVPLEHRLPTAQRALTPSELERITRRLEDEA